MEKLYYSVKEVAKIVGVEEYVLRYWEKEFPRLKPKRFSGRRRYTQKDIDLLLRIKKLLYEEGFTIKGAKAKLREESNESKSSYPQEIHGDCKELLKELKEELKQLKDTIAKIKGEAGERNNKEDRRNTLF